MSEVDGSDFKLSGIELEDSARAPRMWNCGPRRPPSTSFASLIQWLPPDAWEGWIPAFAGMTVRGGTTPRGLDGVELKKQSQFSTDLMGAKSCMGKDYDDKPSAAAHENKAKQNQFGDRPEAAGRTKVCGQAHSGSGSPGR